MTGSVADVLVVGTGPTGLALAAQLAASGVRVRLIDRGLDRVHESRALAIHPRTLEVLAGLGVADELIACGNPAVQLRMHARGRVLEVPMFDLGLDDTADPYLLFVSQAKTERILVEHLAAASVHVERGVELTGLGDTADCATAALRHRDGREEAVSARYVAGCDGAHSTVRRLAGIRFEGSSYPQTFVLADVDAEGVEPGAAHVFLSGQGMLFFFPLGKPAVTDGLITRNPCTSVKPPTAPAARVQPWPAAWVDGVREAMPARYRALADVGAGLGLRQGEAFGLAAEDIDWLRRIVHVRRQVRIIGSTLCFAPPKGGKERDIPLPDSIALRLSAHIAACPPVPVSLPWKVPAGKQVTASLLFTAPGGAALHRSGFNAVAWQPALRGTGLPCSRENGMHALRHYFASACLYNGVDIRALASYLGHHDPGFTLRTYVHLNALGRRSDAASRRCGVRQL